MVYLHEVWLYGNPDPQRFRLETDELFQAFQRWVQKDVQFTANGFVFTFLEKDAAKTVALNFGGVAGIILEKTDEPSRRSGMGFSNPSQVRPT